MINYGLDSFLGIGGIGMDSIASLFEQYGVLAVFLGVLVEQLGAPFPALPLLLMAGATGVDNSLYAVHAFGAAALACMLADSAWFFAGRRYGRKVLSLLCKVSISPDSCVRQSELNFAKWGVATLVIAKFVPGLSTLAPPLAGSLGMRASTFLLFNLPGTALWAGSGIAAGILFNNQIEAMMSKLSDLGGIALSAAAALTGLYIAFRLWRRWHQKRSFSLLPRIAPAELSMLVETGHATIIIDARSAAIGALHGRRIPGALSLEISEIADVDTSGWPDGAHIITYCNCPNDVTALKAAQLLSRKGWQARALAGGIDAWITAGNRFEVIVDSAGSTLSEPLKVVSRGKEDIATT